jgi:hypothetical protein
MARRSKWVDVTVRCLDEGFLFTGKRKDLGHEVNLPGGGTHIEWVKGTVYANCPNDPLHSVEPVEE